MSREVEDLRLTIINLINLGFAYTSSGEYDKTYEALNAALSASQQSGIRIYEPEIHLQRAKAYAESGDRVTARQQAEHAVGLARELGNRAAEAVGAVLLAELSTGDETIVHATEAVRLSRAVKDGLLLLKALHRLGTALLRKGHRQEALTLLSEARDLLAHLADNAGERRELFLSSPDVGEIASDLESCPAPQRSNP
jgi:tetratricopeptide (TPR) repeat protein